jgi:hypothetical protein
MAIRFDVQQGDCISSIASEHGFFWETIWNHPNNAQLKKLRKDPNILFPGDVVFIPDKRLKEVQRPTGHMHRFKLKNAPAKFRLQLFEGEVPRANQAYELTVNGKKFPGKTDAKGVLNQSIPPDATEGELIIGPQRERYTLVFGYLNPLSELSGVQARLNNLGYDCGAADGQMNEETETALRAFQARFGLKETGVLDGPTREKIDYLHDRNNLFPKDQSSAGGPATGHVSESKAGA